MHDAEGESDLISSFLHDPLNFMTGCRDISSQHMHVTLTGRAYALAPRTNTLMGTLMCARIATAYTDAKSFLHP